MKAKHGRIHDWLFHTREHFEGHQPRNRHLGAIRFFGKILRTRVCTEPLIRFRWNQSRKWRTLQDGEKFEEMIPPGKSENFDTSTYFERNNYKNIIRQWENNRKWIVNLGFSKKNVNLRIFPDRHRYFPTTLDNPYQSQQCNNNIIDPWTTSLHNNLLADNTTRTRNVRTWLSRTTGRAREIRSSGANLGGNSGATGAPIDCCRPTPTRLGVVVGKKFKRKPHD